jgi:hypothetical protein
MPLMRAFFRICRAALLWGAASLLASTAALAGSCCGGSSGGALVVPKYVRQLVDVCLDVEKYDGFWNQDKKYISDPPGSDLRQYRLTLGFAQRLAPSWQASIAVPYIWNDNKYSGLSSSSNGVGDATLGAWYEARDDTAAWRIVEAKDLLPSILVGTSLLIPTGVSPYDDVDTSFDVTGRGFYRIDGNILMSKTLHPWSSSVSLSYGTYIKRPVNREYGRYVEPYHKKLGDRFSASASVSYIYYAGTAGDALTGTASFSHMQEADANIDGRRDPDSGIRKDSIGGSIAYSSTDHDWSLRASWNHSMKATGWGENFPATDIFTLGVSYAVR